MPVVHAVDDAHGARGNEVARGHLDARPGHGRVGQPHGEACLDLHTHRTRRLHDAPQCILVGDAHAVDHLHLGTAQLQPLFDLGARAVYQHQPDSQAVEQGDVMDETGEGAVGDRFTAEGEHHGAATVRVDIGRSLAEPAYEGVVVRAHESILL